MIGTEAPHAAELLDDIASLIQQQQRRNATDESRWRDWLNIHNVEHRPPSR